MFVLLFTTRNPVTRYHDDDDDDDHKHDDDDDDDDLYADIAIIYIYTLLGRYRYDVYLEF